MLFQVRLCLKSNIGIIVGEIVLAFLSPNWQR